MKNFVQPTAQTVTVYVTKTCPYCYAVRRFLSNLEVEYVLVNVGNDPTLRNWLVSASGMRTVPQVFIGKKPVGGNDDVQALHRRGKLLSLLRKENIL